MSDETKPAAPLGHAIRNRLTDLAAGTMILLGALGSLPVLLNPAAFGTDAVEGKECTRVFKTAAQSRTEEDVKKLQACETKEGFSKTAYYNMLENVALKNAFVMALGLGLMAGQYATRKREDKPAAPKV